MEEEGGVGGEGGEKKKKNGGRMEEEEWKKEELEEEEEEKKKKSTELSELLNWPFKCPPPPPSHHIISLFALWCNFLFRFLTSARFLLPSPSGGSSGRVDGEKINLQTGKYTGNRKCHTPIQPSTIMRHIVTASLTAGGRNTVRPPT